MEVKVNTCIHNKFDIEVRDAKTNQLKEKSTGYNIILDQYFKIVLDFYSVSYIYFGRGTGTLDITRTSMFDKISNKSGETIETVYAYPTSYVKRKIVLNPEEFVGETITEVGLGGSSSLCTHALLKDSEGNPLSVKKTATDIVTIYATLYVTLPSSFLGGKGFFSDNPSENILLKWLLGDTNNMTDLTVALSDTNIIKLADIHDSRKDKRGVGSTYIKDYANKTLKSPTLRFDVNSANGLLKSLGVYYESYGYREGLFGLNLPCSEIWQGYQANNVNLGMGDGVSTEFDIKCAVIRDNSEVVKVDGIQKGKGIDYNIIYDAKYNGQDGDSASYGKSCVFKTKTTQDDISFLLKYPFWDSSKEMDTNPDERYMIIDLGEQKLIGNIKVRQSNGTSSSYVIYRCRLWGSNDGVNWEPVLDVNNNGQNNTALYWHTFTLPTPAKYRYWKWHNTSSASNSYIEGMQLISGQKALKFATPPSQGKSVTISYITDYIPKDINHVLDVNFTIQLGRA